MSYTPDHDDTAASVPAASVLGAKARASARRAVSDLRALTAIASHEHPGLADSQLEELGLVPAGGYPVEDQADRLIDEVRVALRATVTFEMALRGTALDHRFRIECDVDLVEDGEFDHLPADADGYKVRRVLYLDPRSSLAEVELTGEDREVAEAFARLAVPELGA
jgi:hypothetical protein